MASPLQPSKIIAALDIGSSKISCLIAELQAPKTRGPQDPRQLLKVIGLGQTAARGVRAGAVIDVNEAECAIRIAVDAAERGAQTSISEVIVAISGGRPSSATISGRVRTQTGVVGPFDLDFAVAEALASVHMGNRKILHLSPVDHALDGVSGIGQPLGLHGEELQIDVGVTTVAPAYLRNICHAVERAHLGISGFVLAPYAAGKSALTPDERALGAVVIDMGGAVTSCAFIRGDRLVAARSTNLGGHHLTNDVAQGLATSVAHAERMKTLWGSCIPGGHGDREMLAVPLLGERGTDAVTRVPKAHLTNILRARLEEILEHCAKDLAQGPFAASAGMRVVLTGGTSQLHGVADLASHILQRQVRVGASASLNGINEYQRHGGFAVATGALVHAAKPDVNYAVPQETQDALARQQVGFARRMGRWLKEAL
ncbi:cell division protein FtsA [Aestuariivirga litoralis]|uniref:cell division protein FtsA n=1 Tax=Aestuariivirga litoralis TaxID=2650924 RepID=UPI0018C6D2FC|nr:cell division protein FtsA [Aestuariivirga litoralis]